MTWVGLVLFSSNILKYKFSFNSLYIALFCFNLKIFKFVNDSICQFLMLLLRYFPIRSTLSGTMYILQDFNLNLLENLAYTRPKKEMFFFSLKAKKYNVYVRKTFLNKFTLYYSSFFSLVGYAQRPTFVTRVKFKEKENNLFLMISDKKFFLHLPFTLAREYSFHLMSERKEKNR